jgi:ribonucleoside-diphosphate reductase alpha chain
MAIERIRKRDGRVETFEAGKIAHAILGAMRELGREDAAAAARYAERVEKLLESGRRAQVPTVEQVQDLVERVLADEKDPDLAKAYILHRFRHAGLREAKSVLGVRDDLKLSLNAIRVLEKRYLRKDANGNIAETPSQMFRRVAAAVAAVDAGYEGAAEERANAERFYALMSSLEFLPNSPTLMNAGTDLGQLSACFVLPVEDSMDGIFSALRNMAFIHQSGGGTGFSFSRLRPSGDVVRSTGGVASGPISFIEVFDKATDVIKQGGRRRGANMAILSVDHADAMDFILCKTRPKFLENFNISVSVTDAFMQGVVSGGEHVFINPRTGEATDRRPAREVFDLICSAAWQCGDPGLIFIDEVNRRNPLAEVARIEATNPCVTGDTWVETDKGPRAVKEIVERPFIANIGGVPFPSAPEGFFFTGHKPVVRVSTVEGHFIRLTHNHLIGRMLNVAQRTQEGYWEWCKAGDLRPGDALVRVEEDGSLDGIAHVRSVEANGTEDVYDVRVPRIHMFVANGFMAHNCGEQPLLPYESCNLGSINLTRFVKDGGLDFARLDETVDSAVHFLDNVIDANRFPIPEIERATLDSRKIGLGVMGFSDCLYMMDIPYDSEQALVLAEEVFRRIAERGRAASVRLGERRGSFPLFERSAWKAQGFSALRNATVTTIAPTGTIGLIAGVSSGIEPVFALRYWRTMAEGTTFFETHSEFARRAEALGTDLEGLFSGCARDGSIRACQELPGDLRRVFVVARDISPEWHVRMQAAFQKFSDNGVSKTINLPRSATVEDVRRAYLLAHQLKCKGITVYREGSKEAEVLRAGPPISALDKIPRLNSESCDPRDSTICRRCPG